MSLRLSVRLYVRMEQLGSHCADFHDTWYLNTFRKPVEELDTFTKLWKEPRVLYMKTYVHLRVIYLAEFLLKWEVLQLKFAGKIKPHLLRSVTSAKIVPIVR